MITLFLGDKPSILQLTVISAVLLIGLLAFQLLRRALAAQAGRRHYVWLPYVVGALMGVASAIAAYLRLEVGPNAFFLAIGTCLVGLIALVPLAFMSLFAGGGFFAGRLPMGVVSMLAGTLSLAAGVYTFSQNQSYGFRPVSNEEQTYNTLILAADWLAMVLVPYVVIGVLIGFFASLVRRIKRQHARAAAPTSPAHP